MAATIAAVRQWTGTNPGDDAITALLVEWAGETLPAEQVALSILRARRADVVSGPASFSVSGDYSENQGKTDSLKALDIDIARLERLLGVEPSSSLPSLTQAPICAQGGYR